MFGILERWNNNQVTPSLRKPHELSYRYNNIICIKNSDVRNDVGNYKRNDVRKHKVR